MIAVTGEEAGGPTLRRSTAGRPLLSLRGGFRTPRLTRLYLQLRLIVVSIRLAALDDVADLADTVHQGFETYRAFAPRGWEPPPVLVERARIAERLHLPDAWCALAHDGGRPAGHVALLAARDRTELRRPVPGVGHLWMLFVREPWWGTGLAGCLHELVIEEAAARGYREIRLHTPAGQARARAFYEREGWTTDGVATFEAMLGLDLVEYRRGL
jgi:GNAT superfamily N-acetyltransferase